MCAWSFAMEWCLRVLKVQLWTCMPAWSQKPHSFQHFMLFYVQILEVGLTVFKESFQQFNSTQHLILCREAMVPVLLVWVFLWRSRASLKTLYPISLRVWSSIEALLRVIRAQTSFFFFHVPVPSNTPRNLQQWVVIWDGERALETICFSRANSVAFWEMTTMAIVLRWEIPPCPVRVSWPVNSWFRSFPPKRWTGVRLELPDTFPVTHRMYNCRPICYSEHTGTSTVQSCCSSWACIVFLHVPASHFSTSENLGRTGWKHTCIRCQ